MDDDLPPLTPPEGNDPAEDEKVRRACLRAMTRERFDAVQGYLRRRQQQGGF